MRVSLAELDGPQAPGIVAALGVALIQALQAHGPPPSGSVHPRDVALDEAGAPYLDPVHDSVDDRLVAPELDATGPTAESALYGVGVELHRLATGRLPAVNPGRPGVPPPPASTWAPDIPPRLDRAIAALLSPAPATRRSALADLADLATPLPDLRLLSGSASAPSAAAEAPSRVGTVKVTRAGGDAPGTSSATPSSTAAAVRHVVVVPPEAELDPGSRSALAGSLGVPESVLTELVASGQPVPVHAGLRRAEADAALRRTALPAAVVPPAGVGLPLAGTALAGLGIAGALVGAVLAFVTLAAGLGIAAASLVPLVAGLVAWFLWAGRRQTHARSAHAVATVERARHQTADHALVGPAFQALARARVSLADADLPAVADADVRTGLARMEDELQALATRHDTLAADQQAPLQDEAAAILDGLKDLIDVLAAPGRSEGQVDTAMDQALKAARLAVEVDVSADDPLERARRAAQARKERS